MSIKEKYIAAEQPIVLTREAFEELAASWDGCEGEGCDDIGAALRHDFERLARQSPAPEKAEPIGYARQSELDKLADDRIAGVGMMIHKDAGEGKTAIYLAPVAQEGAQPMHKDVEWLVEAANMARRNPDLATKMRQNCKAGHAVQEVEPGSAPAAADEVRDAARWRFMMRVADDNTGPEAKAMESLGNEQMETGRQESEQMRELVDQAIANLGASAATSEEGGA